DQVGKDGYDVIVVGARCAGSPTAMLLASKGYEVLVVDRTTFPSDTVSTHVVHPPGVAALDRWGLLDQVRVTGCPPIHTYSFDFGPLTISGRPGTAESPVAYCPRRTVLDQALVDGAAKAGAEVRQGFGVDEVTVEDGLVTGIRGRTSGGSRVTERARVVVGADGLRSFVARSVRAEAYNERPPQLCGYYGYWSDLPNDGRFETYIRDERGFAAAPTNDGLTLVVAGWPYRDLESTKSDIEGNYLSALELVPEFAAKLEGATRETRVVGTAVPNFFRTPFGPGWALVGDAGYNRDFITAQGITDAFLDAERCATALDEALSGARPFEEAMGDHQASRDARVGPIYDFTLQLASFEPPPPELLQLLAAVHGNQDAMDGFARVNAGVTSPAEYFAPDNVARIFAAAGAPD
ncbi:MAG: NAD(P)/FAD-dependent oxidoreductase, partial [Acidimicrobiales bacterium]